MPGNFLHPIDLEFTIGTAANPFPWSCVGNSNVKKWFKLKALQNDENILRYGAALTSSKLAVVLAVTSL